MYTAQGFIRDYNPSNDTATVELAGLGIIDAWLDGLKIDIGVNRAALVNGAVAILSLPDPHRICEATVSAVPMSVGAIAQAYKAGRAYVSTNAQGSGSLAVAFGITFPNVPILWAQFDKPAAYSVTAFTATGFTMNLAGALANTVYFFTWSATTG